MALTPEQRKERALLRARARRVEDRRARALARLGVSMEPYKLSGVVYGYVGAHTGWRDHPEFHTILRDVLVATALPVEVPRIRPPRISDTVVERVGLTRALHVKQGDYALIAIERVLSVLTESTDGSVFEDARSAYFDALIARDTSVFLRKALTRIRIEHVHALSGMLDSDIRLDWQGLIERAVYATICHYERNVRSVAHSRALIQKFLDGDRDVGVNHVAGLVKDAATACRFAQAIPRERDRVHLARFEHERRMFTANNLRRHGVREEAARVIAEITRRTPKGFFDDADARKFVTDWRASAALPSELRCALFGIPEELVHQVV